MKCPFYHIKEFGPFPKGPDRTLEIFKQNSKLTRLLLKGRNLESGRLAEKQT